MPPFTTNNNNGNSTQGHVPALLPSVQIKVERIKSLLGQLRAVLEEGINVATAAVPQAPSRPLQQKVFGLLSSLYSILGYENLDQLVSNEVGEQLVFDFFACCGDGRSKKTCVDPLIAEHIWNVLEHLKMSREAFIEFYDAQGSNKPTKSVFFGLGGKNSGRVDRVFEKMGNGECIIC